jgi:hypothetical protein
MKKVSDELSAEVSGGSISGNAASETDPLYSQRIDCESYTDETSYSYHF